jgi:hAT family C-terminal dimerisation region
MLGLIDTEEDESDGGDGEAFSIEDEYAAYISAKRAPTSKPILKFWQVRVALLHCFQLFTDTAP